MLRSIYTVAIALSLALPMTVNAEKTSSPKTAAAEKRYCVMDQTTGSRIPQKICKTRADWLAQDGYDPLADLK